MNLHEYRKHVQETGDHYPDLTPDELNELLDDIWRAVLGNKKEEEPEK